MRALTFHGIADVRVSAVPEPVIERPGDAIVRVRATAICGSDLHVYHGRERGMLAGTVLGHELAGEVVAVGAGVTWFAPGDRVVSPFSTCCGACFYCRRGLQGRCREGQLLGWVDSQGGLAGAQAEQVRVPLADATLVAVPAGVAFSDALLAADVLPTGFHCAAQAGVEAGDVVVVVGCGAVGLMAVVAAREMGAGQVLAVDAVRERLALAEVFAATPLAIDAAPAAVRAATAGRGADAVLEAVGSPEALRLAFDLVRPGGTISSVGVHNEASFAFSPAEAYEKNLTFRSGRCSARRDLERMLEMVAARAAELGRIVTHRLPLSEGPGAYALFAARREGAIKVVLDPGS